MTTYAQTPCRLCHGASDYKFKLCVLRKYQVSYFQCEICGSLQTEVPYWLDEAYSSNLNDLDTGAAHRNLDSLAVTLIVANLLGFSNMVDIGGGDGLLCRLLRDHRKNAYVSDSYAHPVYAQGFTIPDFSTPDMLTAFEVFEHFVDPAEEVSALFARNPSAILIMTTPYRGEGPDWAYLIPDTGHHIFFYSEKALAHVASKYGYDVFRHEDYTLFCKSGLLTKRMKCILCFRLNPRMVRLYRAVLGYRLANGFARDAQTITERKVHN